MAKLSFKSLILIALLVTCHISSALADTRRAYFSQVGRNSVINAMDEPAESFCSLTITNPSQTSQTYSLDSPSITASGVQAGNAALDSGSLSGTINAGESVTIRYKYPTYTTSSTGTQELLCAGTITASDVAVGTPGFIIATGTLITFTESGNLSTTGNTGPAEFKGFAVYTQVPITINRGGPF